MANRLVKLSATENLNSHHPERHWVNKVTDEQEHLFTDGGVFGPEVKPILYNQFSTKWILQHGNRFISVGRSKPSKPKFEKSTLTSLDEYEKKSAQTRHSSPYRQTNPANIPEDLGHPVSKATPQPAPAAGSSASQKAPAVEAPKETQQRKKAKPIGRKR